MSNRTLRIVVVFGLDDGKLNFPSLLSWVWNTKTVRVYPFRAGWRDGDTYASKLTKVLALIDELLVTGDLVALIGVSAGASLVVSAYALRPQLVGVVNVCGALRLMSDPPPKFAKSVESSEAFEHSVLACEASQKRLALAQIRRILIMEPWNDFVPISTMQLRGARVHRVPGINHFQSIATVMIFYRRTIIRFLMHSTGLQTTAVQK